MTEKSTRARAAALPPAAQLVNFLASTQAEDIPQRLYERAKDLLIDHLGVAYCGLHLPWSRMICERAMADGGPPSSTVYGHGKVAARNAALANATVAHAIELDDTHIPSLSHPSAVVFPAALAAAEEHGATGRDFLAAYILGVEAMGRIGRAAGPSLINAAFHPTSTNGVFGAAAAVAKLLQLDAHGIEAAFGLAASMASGVMQFSLESEGTMVKRLHAGLPAERGVLAAQLAAEGFSGPAGGIDGERGFLRVFARHDNSASIAENLGTVFMLEDMTIKVNACCLHFASLVDALNECSAASGLPADRIESVEAFGPKALINGHMEYRPASVMAAQYSLPYVTAATLMLDPRNPDSFDDAVMSRPDLLALADRVSASEDVGLESYFPKKFPARVRIRYAGGKVVESRILDPLGSTERPLTRAGIADKFRALNGTRTPCRLQDNLLAAASDVDAPGGLERLCALLGAGHVQG